MKVFSLTFNSKSDSKSRVIYLYSKESDIHEVIKKSIDEIYSLLHEIGLKIEIVAEFEIVDSQKFDESNMSKNFLLKTIINNGDGKLFNSSKKYLTDSEIEYIKHKIKIQK